MRIEEQDSYSFPYFKSGLFIVVACITVIAVSGLYQPSNSSRALMALPSEGLQIQGLSTETLKNMEEKNRSEEKNRTAVVKVENVEEHGLIALNSDCIKSLMKVEQPSAQVQMERSLTSYNAPTYGQTYKNTQKSNE